MEEFTSALAGITEIWRRDFYKERKTKECGEKPPWQGQNQPQT